MNRKIAVFVLAVLFISSSTCLGLTIDFTQSPLNPGNQGTTLLFPGLEITAKTNLGAAGNVPTPWMTTSAGGRQGSVYWGDLGLLGTGAGTLPPAPASNFIGLGALTPAGQPSNPNGATGPISLRESLVFTFDQAQQVRRAVNFGQVSYFTDLSFTLLGLNYLASGEAAYPADSARVFIQLADGLVISSDMNAGAIPLFDVAHGFNKFLNWMLTAAPDSFYPNKTSGITALAVEEVYGNYTQPGGVREFGVGDITYQAPAPVPEPSTIAFLGTGAVVLVLGRNVRRRRIS